MPDPAAASFAVILPAAGKGRRFGGDKLSLDLAGRSVLARSVALFLNRRDVTAVFVATNRRDVLDDAIPDEMWMTSKLQWCGGGEYRAATVARGLEAVASLETPPPYVAVHDAARPLTSPELIDRVFEAARKFGAAVPGMAVTDTTKRVRGGFIEETVPRAELIAVQTPQAGRRDWFEEAFAATDAERLASATDDAQLLEWAGRPVAVVQGEATNLKLTSPADAQRAAWLLQSPPPP